MAAIRSIFQSSGCKIEPMHVDASGPDPHTVVNRDVKLAFVTAAKQQPMTIAMPMKPEEMVARCAPPVNQIGHRCHSFPRRSRSGT